jgi:hypothetical protein
VRTLQLRLRPKEYEPSHGTFLRLATRNGAKGLYDFAKALRLQRNRIMAGHHRDEIAALAGLDGDDLAKWSVRISRQTRLVQVGKEQVALGDWTASERRVCPHCIKEDTAEAVRLGIDPDWFISHRSIWDISSIGACIRHGVALENRCTACGFKLSWSDPKIGTCRFGCDLGKLMGRHRIADVDYYLAGRIGTYPRSTNPILDQLSYKHAVSLCERLGLAAKGEFSANKPRLNRVARRKALIAGYQQTLNFSTSVDAFLDRIVDNSRLHHRKRGLINSYGWIYTEWAKANKPYADVLRPLLLRHAIRRGIISEGESRDDCPSPGLLSIKDICNERRASFATVKRQLLQLSLMPKGTRPGVRAAIRQPALESLEALDGAKSLGTRSIGSLLGVGRGCARELYELGLLGSVGTPARDSDILDFVTRLKRLCRPNPPDSLMTLRDASRHRNIRLATLISEILHKKLEAWAFHPANSASVVDTILVDARSISLMRRLPMPLTEAANLLDIHPQALGQLVKQGVIQRQNGRGIDPAEVGKFQCRYMPIGWLAARFRTSAKALKEQLSSHGVEPAFGPPETRQLIYARAEAEALLHELSY